MGEKINKVIKVIVGILLLLLGILFLAAPVITAAIAVLIAGCLLIAIGGAEFIFGMLPHTKKEKHASNIVTALFMLFLGILLLILDKAIAVFLPLIVAIWLALFGIHHIILVRQRRKAGDENWISPLAISILAIGGAILLAIMQWVVAVDMTGTLLAVLAMIYGFILLMDVFIKTSKQSVEERIAEDKQIADTENADFRRFQERLNSKDK